MHKLSRNIVPACLKQSRSLLVSRNARHNDHWAIICDQAYASHGEATRRQHKPQRTASRHQCLHQGTGTCSRFSTGASGYRGDGTVDHEEVDKFNHLAQTMWDENGGMRALHSMNQLRVPLIRDALLRTRAPSGGTEERTTALPLQGMNILDVGCGAGILSEPLCRLGARVTGLDAAAENITMARWHSSLDPELAGGRIRYVRGSLEDLSAASDASGPAEHDEQYDGVVASEIVEHVANAASFVSACCSLVKPGGSIFFTTINKTAASFVIAKATAEYVMQIVDPGTHDWNKFISPEDLQSLLFAHGMDTRLVHGMTWNPLTNKWCWIKRTDVNYALHAVKPVRKRKPDSSSDSDSDVP